MSETAVQRRRAPLPMRLRLLIVAAVLVTGLTVFGAIQAIHFSSASTKLGMATTGVGFFMPRSTTPVPFSLASLTAGKGADTSMSSLSGRPVVVNMWASYCTVCTSETPAIESVARTMAAKVGFVGVDSTDVRSAGLAFVHKYGVTYPQLFDPTAIVATGYGIPGLPVTVFITAGGKVAGEYIGALTVTSLRHYLSVLFGD
ncbi:MAG: TlpA disulfide reductase family protein [Acidimicrobiales bacterium]|jgi:thiol-disulfide isomerase/thioredoxin